MIRSALGKVMWVGRATVLPVVLAVMLVVVFGVSSPASAHKGYKGIFHLGHKNVASTVSTLVKKGAGPALSLKVGSGQPPLAVNSPAKVANLNSDRLDNLDSSAFLKAGQKASDADKLDGIDSTGFLRSGGKAADSDKLDGKDSTEFAADANQNSKADDAEHADQADNATTAQSANNADTVDGKHAAEFESAAHGHVGEDITAGTVAEARIAGSIARDAEIMPTVKANDGQGSGLDADTVDGKDSTDFMTYNSTLKPGQTLTGVWGAGAGGSTSQYAAAAINFRPKLPAAIPSTNTHYVSGTSGSYCPGHGQAAAGHLCVYQGAVSGLSFAGMGDPMSAGSGVRELGTILYFDSTTTNHNFVRGTWAVTAP